MSGVAQASAHARRRLALAPIGGLAPPLPAPDAASLLAAQDATFVDYLVWHKLAPLWASQLGAGAVTDAVRLLRAARLEAVKAYLAQASALRELDERFAASGIAYAAMKGAHVREYAWPDAALRPSTDVDVLVSCADRIAAATLLVDMGFRLTSGEENISHEASFERDAVAIDLHWDLLRPGRLRGDPAAQMLTRRVRHGWLWGLDPTDAVFVALVHPAFAKYVPSPNLALVSVVDFALMTRAAPIDWRALDARLAAAGVKTAAWTVLRWFVDVAPKDAIAVPPGFVESLAPGRLRALYLDAWVRNDLASRFLERRVIVQAGMTMFLHDRAGDGLRALWRLRGSRADAADPVLALGALRAPGTKL